MARTRVLIVDDSALVRKVLSEILGSDPGLEVVGTAADPYIARDKIKQLNPDVLTLDVEMPRMDGVTFLRNLMRLRPMPVVMVSTLTSRGASTTLEALALGAVDFLEKPRVDGRRSLDEIATEMISKVKAAGIAKVRGGHAGSRGSSVVPVKRPFRTVDQVIGIGASTGGTEAVREVLAALPGESPPILITQHIPSAFSRAFAMRLDAACALRVVEAEDGMTVKPGCAYVAPGGRHLEIEGTPEGMACRVHDGAPVGRHRPSVDVLFRSLARLTGHRATSVLLTGMGSDGANGMLEMRAAGAATIAQDESSSVVWGMPGAAVKLGAAGSVVPLDQIADQMLRSAPSPLRGEVCG